MRVNSIYIYNLNSRADADSLTTSKQGDEREKKKKYKNTKKNEKKEKIEILHTMYNL
jgi:hypothetical protein